MTENNSNTTNQKVNKKGLSLWTKIKVFFFVIILLAFAVTGSMLYVMINPTSNFAQFAQKYLGFNYVIANKSESSTSLTNDTNQTSDTSSNQPDTNNDPKFLNNILGLGGGQDSQNSSKFADAQPAPTSTEQVVEQVLPSVVSVSVQTNRDALTGSVSEGTGFFVSDEGLIITNKHVIAQLCTVRSSQVQILATDYQDKAWETDLVSVDPTTDLAILKIRDPKGTKFSKVSFFPTQNLKLGMDVIAIGNALGELKNTVTSGIISGIGRNIVGAEADECGGYSAFSDGLIQTDAAINTGNSGGPLFNKSGALVGVNTFKGANAQSIGLSIPADEVSKTLSSYLKNGKISKPYLGVLTNNITDTFKKQNPWLPVDYGAMIGFENGSVYDDSAASKAGLQSGDIILSIDGQEIRASDKNDSPLRKIISKYEAGAKVKLKVLKSKLSPVRDSDGNISQKVEYDPNSIEVEVTLGSLDSPI